MSNKKQLLIQEIERLHNEGELTLDELNQERGRINKMIPEEIDKELELKEITVVEKVSKKKKPKKPSFEEKQLNLLKSINRNTESVKKWVAFWSWLSIATAVLWLIIIFLE
ncbi:hypothetical protein OAA67_04715, partial [Winogradskyella sp.]|nr:hypothetical protein [Winogradskyella sp.]